VGGQGLAVNSFTYSTTGSGGGTPSGQAIVGQGSGRCIDITSFGTVDGTPVQLWDCLATGIRSGR